MGKKAEALWSNRKAIALASGATKNTVQASSYYNVAKIYEEDGKWAEALEQFGKAKSLKENPAYDKGMERMRKKMGPAI